VSIGIFYFIFQISFLLLYSYESMYIKGEYVIQPILPIG